MAPLEKYMIEQGAPTLASLKTGTLFCVDTQETRELLRQIGQWDRRLSGKGISITLLRYNGRRALVYMYRRSQLERDLTSEGAAELLARCGYASAEPEYALSRLRERVCEGAEFPHEIGLFLGYPLCDVLGYIKNRGRNSKLTGWWQVYGDEQSAARQFERFRRCRDIYTRLWSRGKTVQQLTVCA